MRARFTTALAAAGLIAVAACSSGGGVRKPAPVRTYGPEAGRAAAAAPGARAPGPAAVAGPYRWNRRLADAQAQARNSGKLILVASTKQGCTLCEKFRNQIVPAVAGEAGAMSVGYVYDIQNITSPQMRQVDQTLRANLKGASLMPLVGFLTPDLQWVHGFWGARTAQEFRGDVASATRSNPRRSAQAAPIRSAGTTRTAVAAVTNEYGESEWIPAGDVWPNGTDPEPIDAITGTPTPIAPGTGTLLADATPASAPASTWDEAPVSASVLPTQLPSAPATAAAPAHSEALPVPGAIAPIASVDPDTITTTAAPITPERRWSEPVTPAPSASIAPAHTSQEAWGRQALTRALGQIEGSRYDAARATLREIEARMPETSLAREAKKGSIALYNAKRIKTAANDAERDRLLHRARRDLGSSMWGSLFTS